MHKTITIHITDQPEGSVLVQTTANNMLPRAKLTPALAIAYQLLQGLPAGIPVMYWHNDDKAIDLVRKLLDDGPDGFSHNVSEEVRRAAARVLATTGEHWHHAEAGL